VFRIVAIDGNPVLRHYTQCGNGGTAALDLTANNPGLTLFHCHMQLHMDFGFMQLLEYAR
jgi:FtsP/CotA-like multicopper oxidase with cupredoxin domain